MYNLLVSGLAAWRLATMLTKEDGPGRIFRKLREASGVEYVGNNIISYNDYTPLHCIYCTSIYTALVVLCMSSKVRDILAVSGAAAFVEKALSRDDDG